MPGRSAQQEQLGARGVVPAAEQDWKSLANKGLVKRSIIPSHQNVHQQAPRHTPTGWERHGTEAVPSASPTDACLWQQTVEAAAAQPDGEAAAAIEMVTRQQIEEREPHHSAEPCESDGSPSAQTAQSESGAGNEDRIQRVESLAERLRRVQLDWDERQHVGGTFSSSEDLRVLKEKGLVREGHKARQQQVNYAQMRTASSNAQAGTEDKGRRRPTAAKVARVPSGDHHQEEAAEEARLAVEQEQQAAKAQDEMQRVQAEQEAQQRVEAEMAQQQAAERAAAEEAAALADARRQEEVAEAEAARREAEREAEREEARVQADQEEAADEAKTASERLLLTLRKNAARWRLPQALPLSGRHDDDDAPVICICPFLPPEEAAGERRRLASLFSHD